MNQAPELAAQMASTMIDSPRGRRRVRGGPRRAQQAIVTQTVGARAFGGQLTRTDANQIMEPAADLRLNVEASEFTPNMSATPESCSHRVTTTKHAPRQWSASSAPDIATRIHDDINNKIYECSICTSVITRRDKIWSCHTCWSVLHLHCVKKWSSKSLAAAAAAASQAGLEPSSSLTWRCPGCNLPTDVKPSLFKCWCEKETDAGSLPGLPPFSCGQTCNRARPCPHPCSDMCHAGPCEPCPHIGPTQSCFCGGQDKTRSCLDTDYVNGWSCGEVCNELMPCGEHSCGRPCHEGFCGACEVPVEATCYCGQDQSTILCRNRGAEITSFKEMCQEKDGSTVQIWTGSFNCNKICNREFDCGEHHCDKPCHTQTSKTPHCPRAPDIVTHCPCGKTNLEEILTVPRLSCKDDIPTCHISCAKPLPCGHLCKRVCHSGDCYPCFASTDISCRCGKTSTQTMCHQGILQPPLCLRICRANLNCGRHECGEHCCPGERKAADRVSSRKKASRNLNMSSLGPDRNFEAEHICTRVCGRPLKCGNHTCPELCHRGPCNSCREAIFEEISCDCGNTVLQPPLPCGTQPPPCRFDCERPKACGHPQVAHPCHPSTDSCPKCPFLTTKPCLCGKNKMRNQPCGLELVRCGEVCGKKLKCGYHTCRKGCHKIGECEDASIACTQACGKEKSCSHPCSAPCHSPFLCKEDKPCSHKIFITCTCQRIKQEARCGASKNTPGNTEKTLSCDDECLRLERNRALQHAFNISASHQDDHIPYGASTINKYLANPTWASAQEKLIRGFAIDPDQRRMRLKPMKRDQRAFIHCLSQDFGLDSESLDPEPHRHVALFKTPKFVMAPMKSLADCVRIRQTQTVVTLPSISANAKPTRAGNISNEPFNALLITRAKFGLTIEELRRTFATCLPDANLAADLIISFLPSEEVVIQSPSDIAPSDIKEIITTACHTASLGSVQECRVDLFLNVESRESDANAGGWSQVAKAASAPMRRAAVERPLQSKSSFVVLGSSMARKKKNKAKVADDWEMAEEQEEQEEESRRSSGELARDC